MFAKLLKHEFRSNTGILGVLSLAVLGVGALGALILRTLLIYGQRLEEMEDALAGIAFSGLYLALWFIALTLILYTAAVQILLLVRFYQHKFTDQGYLTFTLPVKAHQLFLSSFVNMLIWAVISLLVVAVATGIIVLFGVVIGDPLNLGELSSEIETMEDYFGSYDYNALIPIHILQYSVSGIYSIVMGMTCLTVGSTLAKKHKILTAIGIYYALSFVTGLVSSVSTLFSDYFYTFETFEDVVSHTWQTALVSIATQVVLIAAGYLVSTHLMKKKLNLP